MALQAILAVPVSNPYESRLSTGRKRKQPVAFATSCLSLLRKKGDSNPRYPVKGIPVFETSAKWMVVIFAALELLFGITGTVVSVAHFAHLGGMLFGWLLIRYWRRKGTLFNRD